MAIYSSSTCLYGSRGNGDGNNIKIKRHSPKDKLREKPEFKKILLEEPSNTFEITALIAMILSVLGVFMDWKWSSWASICVAFRNITNYCPEKEMKQIFSSLFICSSSVMLQYMKNSAPILES